MTTGIPGLKFAAFSRPTTQFNIFGNPDLGEPLGYEIVRIRLIGVRISHLPVYVPSYLVIGDSDWW